jgi:hypothetical protein
MKGVSITVDASSLRGFVQNLQKVRDAALERGRGVVVRNTQAVFDKAQARCPVDTGMLKESARSDVESRDDVVTGAVGYGNQLFNPNTFKTTAAYAVDRHETMTFKNPQAYKWLERTMLEQGSAYMNDLEQVYQDLFGGD